MQIDCISSEEIRRSMEHRRGIPRFSLIISASFLTCVSIYKRLERTASLGETGSIFARQKFRETIKVYAK